MAGLIPRSSGVAAPVAMPEGSPLVTDTTAPVKGFSTTVLGVLDASRPVGADGPDATTGEALPEDAACVIAGMATLQASDAAVPMPSTTCFRFIFPSLD
jgi:hypothetical protein